MVRVITVSLMMVFANFAINGCFAGTNEMTEDAIQNMKSQVNANNSTGVDLYYKLNSKKGNIVISPYSIGTAMSMALAGAEGTTETEMKAVMHQKLLFGKMNSAAGNLHKTLNSLNGEGITLETANGLCVVNNAMVCDSYKKVLQKDYSAELFFADNVKPINEWVDKKTKGKIPEILNSLPANSVCVILNAIYFKGLWENQFKKSSTSDADFFLGNGKKIKTPMMRQSDKFAMIAKKDFSAVELPFKGKYLSFIAILPPESAKFADFEKSFSSEKAESIIASLKKIKHPDKIDIAIPKFKIEYDAELVSPFLQLGMKDAFSAKLADFGRLTGKKNRPGLVWISQIKHKAFIEINEEGGEAAAATAVVMQLKCAIMRRRFIANRPFLFLIKDNKTDSILFLGRVVNPKD